MKQKYFETTIDELGRINIPKEVLDELGIQEKDALNISLIDGELALFPVASKICAICGAHDASQLYDFGDKHLCHGCIVAIDGNELATDHCAITDVRKIDELGRVVLPFADRKTLNIDHGDKVFIYVDNGGIFIKAAVKSCYLCYNTNNLITVGNFNFCSECLEKISKKSKEAT